ncbi:MAG TPA: sialidase family protein [Solirubrobacteraceae bacterium]|nr:sialidase family protein [Solirubrobacteraceae bacterium]
MRSRIWLGVLGLLLIGALFGASSAQGARFTKPIKLVGAAGGEPSIATDSHGDVFVDGPQGIPSGLNGHGGVGFWVSRNDGTTFGSAKLIGSDLGGGDSDVLYSKGAVYVADLEAAATQICKSTNLGATFFGIGPLPDPAGCTTVNGGQAGPSDDRPWLTAAPAGTLYLTYHEFVSAQPIAFRSDNGGGDLFAHPCGSLITNPSIEANVPTDITGGTLVARPVTDKHGNLYVLFATTTQQENIQAQSAGQPSGTFSQLYLAVSRNRCQSFTDYTVFDGQKRYGENTVQFGDIFNDLAIDGAGNLYVVGAGAIGKKQFPTTANIYMFRSTDAGKRWSAPHLVGGTAAAHMLPAAVAGPRAGQLAIGYFRTTNGIANPNSTKATWTYGTAESTDAASRHPRFRLSEVNPGEIYHRGDICNEGILCGTVPGGPSDRSLLDFTSAALDRHGCPLFTFAGNPTGSPGNNTSANTFNYVTRQTSGCFSAHAARHRRHAHHLRDRRAVSRFTG